MEKAIADLGLGVLPVTTEYADIQTRLAYHHRDPFDRLLVTELSRVPRPRGWIGSRQRLTTNKFQLTSQPDFDFQLYVAYAVASLI